MGADEVKTMQSKGHVGTLGRRGHDEQDMGANDISRIDLVVVNLYPFEATVANADCSLEDAIENIDIGGPTMVRSAAKNNASVGIVTNASDYQRVLDDMAAHNGALSDTLRFDLAITAFEHTAPYESTIANYSGPAPIHI